MSLSGLILVVIVLGSLFVAALILTLFVNIFLEKLGVKNSSDISVSFFIYSLGLPLLALLDFSINFFFLMWIFSGAGMYISAILALPAAFFISYIAMYASVSNQGARHPLGRVKYNGTVALQEPPMTPEQREQMQHHVSALAQILYDDAQAEGMSMGSLGEIEQTVRAQLQSYVSPELGIFLSTQVSAQMIEKPES